MRRCYSVVMERTVAELGGTACLELNQVTPAKRQIMVSRSFGTLIERYPELPHLDHVRPVHPPHSQ